MSGLLTSVLPRAKPKWPRLELRANLQRSRQRAAEREYQRMVASDHAPRELRAPFYREVPRRRWYS
jgi:hypothetical protein